MSRWKRGLASLLAAALLVTLLPSAALAMYREGNAASVVSEFASVVEESGKEGDVELYSMMPLKEERLEVDLTGYFPSELANVRLETLLPKVRIPDGSSVTWAKLGDGQYTISTKNGMVDLSKERRDTSLEIIVGTADQLDRKNIRYLVTVHIDAPDFDGVLDMDATYASEERGSIRVLSSRYHHPDDEFRSSYQYFNDEDDEERVIGEYRFTVDETWRDGPAYLSMRRSEAEESEKADETSEKKGLDALTVDVYEGLYPTLEDFQRAAGNAANITSRVWETALNTEKVENLYKTNLIADDEDASPVFTVVWRRSGNAVAVMPFRVTVDVMPRGDHVVFSAPETINRKNAAGEDDNQELTERDEREDEDEGITTVFYQIPVAGLNTNDRYNVRAVFRHFDEQEGYSEQSYSEYGIKVYAGNVKYGTIEEAAGDTENARDVTTQIFAGGFSADFSRGIIFSAFNDKGELITCYGIQTVPQEALEFGSLYKANDSDFQPVDPYEGRGSSYERLYQMPSFAYMASDPYTIRADYIRNLAKASYQTYGVKVLAGPRSYETYEEALTGRERMTDVTAALLSDSGYTTDFSRGVVFTAYNGDGDRIDRMVVRTMDFRSPSLSEDTYFRMRGANSPGRGQYQVYQMPADADGYYQNGYQTLFLLDNGGGQVTDGRITPVFYTPDPKTTIYAGHDESGEKQQSGVTAVDFVSGRPIHYSAAAENGTHLKNYWVTFLTRQEGPSLFVNAANDTEHLDQSTGLPVREVFITGQTGGYHDVFFANIGDEPIENLSVSLERGNNLYLDSYWTIRDSASAENRVLSTFTSTDSDATSYGELPNVGKVRLYPRDIQNTGDIDDTLVIRYDGGEQRVKLSGKIGDIQITTPEGPIRDGVRYVVYSRLLQTNNLYGGDLVSFEVTDGHLPEGYTIKPNGEIYGVTGEVGEFTFTVTATFTYNGIVRSTDSKEYTLTIKPNTDENVDAETDVEDGYQVNNWIPNLILRSDSISPNNTLVRDDSGTRTEVVLDGYHDVYFESNGEFEYFESLWLNGTRLVEGVDFEVNSGTTEGVVYAKTNEQYGNLGVNTISLAGRPNGLNAEASRTNQNYTITVNPSATTSGNSGTGSGTSGGNTGNSGNTGGNRGGQNTGNTGGNSSGNSGNSRGNSTGNTGGTGSAGNNTGTRTTNWSNYPFQLHTATVSHGTIRLSRSTATPNTVVTITLTPDPGYEVRSVTAWGTNIGGSVAISGSGNTRTFIMPTKQVTVSAEFVLRTMGTITDVVGTDWYFEDVKWVYDRWYMRGVNDNLFQPIGPVSGVSSVVSLRRLDGVDLLPYYTGENDGLDNSAWYVGAARWAKVSGILPDGKFMGHEAVSRGYIAVMLKNYLDYRGIHVNLPQTPVVFSDANQMSAEELEAFRILYQAGIFRGNENRTMDPRVTATRLDLALLLHRLYEYVERD